MCGGSRVLPLRTSRSPQAFLQRIIASTTTARTARTTRSPRQRSPLKRTMITRRAGSGRSRRSTSSASLYTPSPTTGAVWSSPRTLRTSITPRPLLRMSFRSPSRLRISRTTNGRRSSSTGAMRQAMLSRKSPSPATWSCTLTISSP